MSETTYDEDMYINPENKGRDIEKEMKSCLHCKNKGKGPLERCKDNSKQHGKILCGFFE